MGISKFEVEEGLKNKGDFVKIDFLNKCLRNSDTADVKRFILLKLADIYVQKGFLVDAAKHIDSAAEMAVTYKDKIELYMKESEMYVKLGQFDMADGIFRKALLQGTLKEKEAMQEKYFNFYVIEAAKYERDMKQRKAAEYYEKLYSMPQTDEKRKQMKEKLVGLYSKLGRIRDSNRLAASKSENTNPERPKIEPGSFEDLGIKKY